MTWPARSRLAADGRPEAVDHHALPRIQFGGRDQVALGIGVDVIPVPEVATRPATSGQDGAPCRGRGRRDQHDHHRQPSSQGHGHRRKSQAHDTSIDRQALAGGKGFGEDQSGEQGWREQTDDGIGLFRAASEWP